MADKLSPDIQTWLDECAQAELPDNLIDQVRTHLGAFGTVVTFIPADGTATCIVPLVEFYENKDPTDG